MMRGETSLQGIPQRGQLGAKAASSQLRQDFRVGCPADQRLEHRPSRGTKYAGGYRRELYPGILEHLLQTFDLPCALLDLRLAVAGEVPELPDLFRWHEAGAHQPVLHELADPLGVLDVSLPARDVLEVPGIEKPQHEVVFQHVVDGLPVDPGGLHAYQPHLEGSQPVPQQQQPSSGGGELPNLLTKSPALLGDPHARGDRALVHVEHKAHRSMILSTSVSLRSCAVLPSSPRGASFVESLVFVL